MRTYQAVYVFLKIKLAIPEKYLTKLFPANIDLDAPADPQMLITILDALNTFPPDLEIEFATSKTQENMSIQSPQQLIRRINIYEKFLPFFGEEATQETCLFSAITSLEALDEVMQLRLFEKIPRQNLSLKFLNITAEDKNQYHGYDYRCLYLYYHNVYTAVEAAQVKFIKTTDDYVKLFKLLNVWYHKNLINADDLSQLSFSLIDKAIPKMDGCLGTLLHIIQQIPEKIPYLLKRHQSKIVPFIKDYARYRALLLSLPMEFSQRSYFFQCHYHILRDQYVNWDNLANYLSLFSAKERHINLLPNEILNSINNSGRLFHIVSLFKSNPKQLFLILKKLAKMVPLLTFMTSSSDLLYLLNIFPQDDHRKKLIAIFFPDVIKRIKEENKFLDDYYTRWVLLRLLPKNHQTHFLKTQKSQHSELNTTNEVLMVDYKTLYECLEKILDPSYPVSPFVDDSSPCQYGGIDTHHFFKAIFNTLNAVKDKSEDEKNAFIKGAVLAIKKMLVFRWKLFAHQGFDYLQNPLSNFNQACLLIATAIADKDEAICQLLMPTITASVTQTLGQSLKQDTELNGLFPLHEYCLCEDNRLLHIPTIFLCGKENPAYLFEPRPDGKHFGTFNLTYHDLMMLRNSTAGASSHDYYDTLFKVDAGLNTLAGACDRLTSSIKEILSADTISIAKLKELLQQFTYIWNNFVSEENRGKIGDLTIHAKETQTLKTNLISLFDLLKSPFHEAEQDISAIRSHLQNLVTIFDYLCTDTVAKTVLKTIRLPSNTIKHLSLDLNTKHRKLILHLQMRTFHHQSRVEKNREKLHARAAIFRLFKDYFVGEKTIEDCLFACSETFPHLNEVVQLKLYEGTSLDILTLIKSKQQKLIPSFEDYETLFSYSKSWHENNIISDDTWLEIANHFFDNALEYILNYDEMSRLIAFVPEKLRPHFLEEYQDKISKIMVNYTELQSLILLIPGDLQSSFFKNNFRALKSKFITWEHCLDYLRLFPLQAQTINLLPEEIFNTFISLAQLSAVMDFFSNNVEEVYLLLEKLAKTHRVLPCIKNLATFCSILERLPNSPQPLQSNFLKLIYTNLVHEMVNNKSFMVDLSSLQFLFNVLPNTGERNYKAHFIQVIASTYEKRVGNEIISRISADDYPQLITNFEQLSILLTHLPENIILNLIQTLLNNQQLFNNVTNIEQLCHIMAYCQTFPDIQSTLLKTTTIPIQNSVDLSCVLKVSTNEIKEYLVACCDPGLIKSCEDLHNVVVCKLPSKPLACLLKKLDHHLIQILETRSNLSDTDSGVLFWDTFRLIFDNLPYKEAQQSFIQNLQEICWKNIRDHGLVYYKQSLQKYTAELHPQDKEIEFYFLILLINAVDDIVFLINERHSGTYLIDPANHETFIKSVGLHRMISLISNKEALAKIHSILISMSDKVYLHAFYLKCMLLKSPSSPQMGAELYNCMGDTMCQILREQSLKVRNIFKQAQAKIMLERNPILQLKILFETYANPSSTISALFALGSTYTNRHPKLIQLAQEMARQLEWAPPSSFAEGLTYIQKRIEQYKRENENPEDKINEKGTFYGLYLAIQEGLPDIETVCLEPASIKTSSWIPSFY